MKKIAILLLLFLSISSFSQISKIDTTESEETILIGKVAPMGQFIISCEKKGNTYIFTYRDIKYTQIVDYKSFSFEDTDDAFENLYTMIMDGFKNTPEEDIMLDIPDGYLWLSYSKMFGAVGFSFGHSVYKDGDVIGFSAGLSKKKVMQLFGKKKK